MCTVVFLRNAFANYPVVVIANRDEFFARPAKIPTFHTKTPDFAEGVVWYYAPTDLQRGGTWIGVNSRGVCVAITNRKAIPSVRGARSRGDIVRGALMKGGSAQASLETVLALEQDAYNGFHLLIADQRDAYLVIGDGTAELDGRRPGFHLEKLADGQHIITNLGIGSASPRTAAILSTWEFDEIGTHPPLPNSLSQVLRLHAKPAPKEDPVTHRLTGTCIHPIEGDPDYGTRSSNVIRLCAASGSKPADWEYWHVEHQPAQQADCRRIQWDACRRLPISA